jgi:hypothetical protein
MRPREWKIGECRVIEGRGAPRKTGMAHAAIMWESGLNVVGIGCTGKVLLVTSITGRRSSLEVAANMAGGAIKSGVNTYKRVTGVFKMIKLRPQP